MRSIHTLHTMTPSYLLIWIFSILFFVIGILNLVLVHPVPGTIYLLISLIYFPKTDAFLKKYITFSIPPMVKIIAGIILLWGTLAITDLAEILGM